MTDPDWATWKLVAYEVRDELSYRPLTYIFFSFVLGVFVGVFS